MKKLSRWTPSRLTTTLACLCCLFSSLFLNLGCQHSPPENCSEPDWFEIGRRDGSAGKRIGLEHKYLGVCEKSNSSQNFELYKNGREAGLNEFCKPKNGFELGKAGQTYTKVCPPEIESDFLKFYMKGQHVHKLRQKNESLIEELSLLRNDAPQNLSFDQKEKILSLQKEINDNNQTIQKLSL